MQSSDISNLNKRIKTTVVFLQVAYKISVYFISHRAHDRGLMGHQSKDVQPKINFVYPPRPTLSVFEDTPSHLLWDGRMA